MKAFDSDGGWIGLDRLATWDEVRYAIAFLSRAACQPGCSSAGSSNLEPDFTGCVARPKSLAWSPFVSKKLDPKSN
jgi:hypothetical protein